MDKNQLILYKKEIATTTNTLGWRYILDLAEKTVADMERKAIDEDDDDKGTVLRRQAKAARAFLNDFIRNVDVIKFVDVEPTEAADGDALITY